MVVTKSGMGTWGLGHGDWDMGLGDVGLRDVGLGDRIVSMQGVLKLLKTSWAAMKDFPGK